MTLRAVTGYIAHVLIVLYWFWVIVSTAPQLRKGVRDRWLRVRVVMLRTAVLVVLFLAVGVIHFWATEWWHAVAAVVGATVACVLLHRAYRRLVAPPRHRITLRQRALGREARVPTPRTGDEVAGIDPGQPRHRRPASSG